MISHTSCTYAVLVEVKKKKMNALGKESQFDGLNHDVHKLRKRSILHFTLNVKISKYFANLCRF